MQRLLQNPVAVAAVSDRRPSLPAISAVGDRRYRVLQEVHGSCGVSGKDTDDADVAHRAALQSTANRENNSTMCVAVVANSTSVSIGQRHDIQTGYGAKMGFVRVCDEYPEPEVQGRGRNSHVVLRNGGAATRAVAVDLRVALGDVSRIMPTGSPKAGLQRRSSRPRRACVSRRSASAKTDPAGAEVRSTVSA